MRPVARCGPDRPGQLGRPDVSPPSRWSNSPSLTPSSIASISARRVDERRPVGEARVAHGHVSAGQSRELHAGSLRVAVPALLPGHPVQLRGRHAVVHVVVHRSLPGGAVALGPMMQWSTGPDHSCVHVPMHEQMHVHGGWGSGYRCAVRGLTWSYALLHPLQRLPRRPHPMPGRPRTHTGRDARRGLPVPPSAHVPAFRPARRGSAILLEMNTISDSDSRRGTSPMSAHCMLTGAQPGFGNRISRLPPAHVAPLRPQHPVQARTGCRARAGTCGCG